MSITIADNVRTQYPRQGLNRLTAAASGLLSRGRGVRRGNSRHVVRRSLVLIALISILVGAVGMGRSVSVAAPQATPAALAGHPLVGTWVVDPELDDPRNPPSFDAFMADGTLVNIGSDGASVGTWEATGSRTATFTFAGLVQNGGGEAAFILRGNLKVDEAGENFTGSHSFTLVSADGTVLAAAQGGTANGTHLHSEPLEAGGQSLPGLPTWVPATAGTPTP